MLAIAFLLVGFYGCSNDDSNEISEDPFALPNEVAIELIERDRKITEMFVCNSLFGEYKGELSTFLPEDSEFYSFLKIEELLDSTYVSGSEDKALFLNYPSIGEKSVSDFEGKTKLFYHAGSSYEDFIDINTVSVVKTEDDIYKNINAKTLSGKDVTLKAVYHDGKWLLVNGIYRKNPKQETVNIDPTYSNLGSLCDFRGKILVIELFVSDSETEFSAEQEKVFHNKIEKSLDYLKVQSNNYGNEVEITYETAYYHHAGIVGTRPIDFDLDFAETTFGSLEGFAKANFAVSEYDNYFFMLCLDKNLNTSASKYEDSETAELYFGERVSVGRNSTSEAICESVLELLGAFDYNDERFAPYVNHLFETYFPNEFLVNLDFTSSVISPVTAYVCGMTDEINSLYKIFLTNR